jgi:hypothetical protein
MGLMNGRSRFARRTLAWTGSIVFFVTTALVLLMPGNVWFMRLNAWAFLIAGSVAVTSWWDFWTGEPKRDDAQLRFFIAPSVPFLEEAWHACFHGQEAALLSAEERGMARLLHTFREVAAGRPALPPGVITLAEAYKRTENAIAWANALIGKPGDLAPGLSEWIFPGETCVHGLRRANAEVERLRALTTEVPR